MHTVGLTEHDALIVVDLQNDFLPGGSVPVSGGDAVIPVLNRTVEQFSQCGLPIYATRDWHPPGHCSFQAQGGIWPPHCVADTPGAAFPAAFKLPQSAVIVSKATSPQKDAYSGFDGTDLAAQLHARGVERLFVGGLATDYCVLNTVNDALTHGFDVVLLTDAIRAVDREAGDGDAAIAAMRAHGASTASSDAIDAAQVRSRGEVRMRTASENARPSSGLR